MRRGIMPCLVLCGLLASATGAPSAEVTIHPKEYPRAFRNPLKGFLGSAAQEYASTDRVYVKWCDIEESAGDGVQKLLDYTNRAWGGVERRNGKIIPRVFLEWPEGNWEGVGQYDTFLSYWPRDMVVHDWESDAFKRRLARMIDKMGRAWDDDPRIAFIEMALIGPWGEQHHPFPSDELQKLMGDAFRAAFKHKLVMNRYPWHFKDYPFGIHWDSFGIAGWEMAMHVPEFEGRLADRWKTAPMGGEVKPDDPRFAGEEGPLTHIVRDRCDSLVRFIRRWHWNMLGWVSGYDRSDPVTAANAERVQKALGYRFVLDEVRYPAQVRRGGEMAVSFVVRNIGAAPFYYNWPVEVSLLDPRTRRPAWKAVFPDVDLRSWLPGNFSDIGKGRPVLDAKGKVCRIEWDTGLDYDIKPQPVRVSGTFRLPAGLKAGCYILALAILDPAGGLPSVRFATVNYFNGGRHPMGRIGVGVAAGNPELNEREFDDLRADASLHYVAAR